MIHSDVPTKFLQRGQASERKNLQERQTSLLAEEETFTGGHCTPGGYATIDAEDLPFS